MTGSVNVAIQVSATVIKEDGPAFVLVTATASMEATKRDASSLDGSSMGTSKAKVTLHSDGSGGCRTAQVN